MRFILLSLLFAGLLGADTTTVTYSVIAGQSCSFPSACSPLDFSIPQFSGDPADLSAVTWTFTDTVQYLSGYNDMSVAPFQPLTLNFSVGDQSAMLGLDASVTTIVTSLTCGCRDASAGAWWSDATIEGSGTRGSYRI
jgi:hypothetical protein